MEVDIFRSFPEIITERLDLREIKQDDAENIYDLLSKPEVVRYDTFELFTNKKQAEDLISWFHEEFQQRRSIFWGITLKDDPKIIGFCKCEVEVPKIRADLGYDLCPNYWNKGIMTEALSAVINYAFLKLQVNRVEAAASTRNVASVRVLEKIGFMKEGILRERSLLGGGCHDMIMLSILKREYSPK